MQKCIGFIFLITKERQYERVYLRTIDRSYVGCTSLHGSHSSSRWTVMDHPVLLGSSLTDDEFNYLFNLSNFPKYPGKNISYFWILSDLSIGCSPIRPHQDFSNHVVVMLDEFLTYIEQQKLLRTIQ